MTKTDVLESLGFKRHLKGYAMPLQGLCRHYIELRGWEFLGVFERGQTFGGRRPTLMYFKKKFFRMVFLPESFEVILYQGRNSKSYYCPDLQSFIELEKSLLVH